MARMRGRFVAALLLCFVSIGGRSQDAVDAQSAATITILHINDVYEINAIEGGRAGGLSRAATVLHRLERTQSPVLMTLGGDFLSPSAIGTAIVDGPHTPSAAHAFQLTQGLVADGEAGRQTLEALGLL